MRPRDIYQSHRWRKLRHFVFWREKGLCRWCKAKGRVVAGEDCHHVEPLTTAKGMARAFDPQGVVLLCKECHREAHEKKVEMKPHPKWKAALEEVLP